MIIPVTIGGLFISVPKAYLSLSIFDAGDCVDAAADIIVSYDLHPSWLAGFYQIVEYHINRVFLIDPDVPVRKEVIFKGPEFDTALSRDIVYFYRCEIRESGPGTDDGKFIRFYIQYDFSTGIFIGEDL
jgi:hypothetical protein